MIATELEKYYSKLTESFEREEKNDFSSRKYELLHHLITTVLNDPQKHSLEKILIQIHLLNTEGYTNKSHIGLIIYFESLKSYTDKSLLPKLIKRVQSQLKREVQFLKMKDPDSDFNHKICDQALASVENLTPSMSNLSEDEMNFNVLLNEIIKYRQNTLSDEEAWDHAAQIIHYKTMKAPS